jgi:predicted acetyltransferase
MLFESEKAANTFMKFNSEEIAELNGHAPIRSYFCIACNGWHVTSHPEEKYAVSRTERVLDSYKVFKEKQVKNREALVIRNREMREIRIRVNKQVCVIRYLIHEITNFKAIHN